MGAVELAADRDGGATAGVADPPGGARIGAGGAGGTAGPLDTVSGACRVGGDGKASVPAADERGIRPEASGTEPFVIAGTAMPANDGVAPRTGCASSPRVLAAVTRIATSRVTTGCMPKARNGKGRAVRPRAAAVTSATNEIATCDHQIQTTTATTRISTPGGRAPLSTAATTDDHAGSLAGSGFPTSLTRHAGTPARNVPSTANAPIPDNTAQDLRSIKLSSLPTVSLSRPAVPATPAAAEATRSSTGGADAPRGTRPIGGAHSHVPPTHSQHAHTDIAVQTHRGPVALNRDGRLQA